MAFCTLRVVCMTYSYRCRPVLIRAVDLYTSGLLFGVSLDIRCGCGLVVRSPYRREFMVRMK